MEGPGQVLCLLYLRKEMLMDLNKDGVTVLKDSGNRLQFESGAVRDIQEGKGRCDLLPLDVVGDLLDAPELKLIEKFKMTKDVKFLYEAIKYFAITTEMDIYTLMLELSKHFESGAVKYGENNWMKGMDLHCYLSSGPRHFLEYKRGDTDEPHNRAFVWNMICAAWTYIHKPELDDVNRDIMQPNLSENAKSPNQLQMEAGLNPVNI